jgi:hypothetical protein
MGEVLEFPVSATSTRRPLASYHVAELLLRVGELRADLAQLQPQPDWSPADWALHTAALQVYLARVEQVLSTGFAAGWARLTTDEPGRRAIDEASQTVGRQLNVMLQCLGRLADLETSAGARRRAAASLCVQRSRFLEELSRFRRLLIR